MNRYSIEQRLVKRTLAIIGSVLVLISLLLATSVNYLLERDYNHHLLAKARLLATLTKDRINKIELDFADEFMPEFESRKDPEYFQLWFADGRELERSRSLRQASMILPIEVSSHASKPEPLQTGHQMHDMVLPDGRAGRRVQLVFIPQIPRRVDRTPENMRKQPQMILVVAKERESLLRMRNTVYAILIVATGFAIVLLSALLKRGIRQEFMPIKQLQMQIEKMDTEHLQERLHLQVTPQELSELITQFNQLMDRMQQSFLREQRFSADVAHELRTPIAEIRTMAEVALRCRDGKNSDANTTPAVDTDFYADILAASSHMQNMVNNLLVLARCENGQVELQPIKIDLNEAITTAWRHHQANAAEKSIVLSCHFATPCFITSSAIELDLILNNLLANAVEYSPPHSQIVITLSNTPVRLCITNQADNLTPADLPLLFERMWRKDPARTDSQHAGIGLALVKAYADLLALEITVTLTEQHEFSLTLSKFTAG